MRSPLSLVPSPRLRRRALALLAVASGALATLIAAPASATSYAMMSDSALLAQAKVVVDARVVAADPAPTVGERPATDYTIEVSRVLKGDVPASTLVVRVPGGVDAAGRGLEVYGAPRFAQDEQALLFLRPADDGTYRVVQLMLGVFHQRRVGGRSLALRDLSEAHEVGAPPAARRDGVDDARDFSAFAEWVEDRTAGRPVRERGYVVGRSSGELSSVSAGYTLLVPGDGIPIRWFDFDNGGNVAWRVQGNGQPGLGLASTVAAFQTALAAWNDDPSTGVALSYAGTTPNANGLSVSDDVNAILFDDPFRSDPAEAVEGTFSCREGGVIAMGGPWYDGSTRTRGGKRYHPALEADIVTNDGTECYFQNDPLVAAEVFAHELGHTLGLGHSGDRDALMYANAHDDGRGARLGADDRAALAELYGATSGAGSGGGKPLAAPSRLVGRTLSASAVTLQWRDRASGEAQYVVEVKSPGGRYRTVLTLPADATAATIGDLRRSTRYLFRVRAVAAGGQSSPYSNVVSVRTAR